MSDFGLVTGAAGCGKTYSVRTWIDEDPGWGLLTATTGVAARNLGDNVPTVHSALGFYDLASLRTLSAKGDLTRSMRKVLEKHERVVIDEASMLTREGLEILHKSAGEAGLGLWLVGDFLQLPPIVINNETERPWWAFTARCWPEFAENTRWLTTNHRQSSPEFKAGLNHLRAGHGDAALRNFKHCEVRFTTQLDYRFPGTTIVGTNKVRADFNGRMYNALDGEEKTYNATRWGKQRPEWKRDIAEAVSLKVGARVMALRNQYDDDHSLLYANGDTGTVTHLSDDCVSVMRDRDGAMLDIEFIDIDDAVIIGHEYRLNADGDEVRVTLKSKPNGGVRYMPLTQAWAVTVHKSQGLTLDAVQVNLPEGFYGFPAMVYTACSRCKTPENLVLVGGDRWLAQRCNVDREVRAWIDAPRAIA